MLPACTVVCGAALAQVTPVGGEIQVNTHFTNNQYSADVGVDAAGNFVVTWESAAGQDGSAVGIFARRFTSAGVPQAAEFQVNLYTPGNQRHAAVSVEPDGDFVIAWQSQGQDGAAGYSVFGRRFDSAGSPQGVEFQVNAATIGAQRHPSIVASPQGGFVVAFSGQDGDSYGVFARRFDAAGVPQASELQLNTHVLSGQWYPAVAVDRDGDFVVAWQSFGQDGDSVGVFARRFDSGGSPQDGEFQVNTSTVGYQNFPEVGIDGDGNFVIAWWGAAPGGSVTDIFAQRFDASGLPQAGEFQVNAFSASSERFATLAVDADGDFVVSWRSEDQDGSMSGVFARRFDAAGTPQAAEFQVNVHTEGSQGSADIAMMAGGDFVVAWQSDDQDGSQNGVFARRFKVPKAFDVDANGAASALTDGLLFLRYAFGLRGTALISGAVAGNCARCTQGPVEGYLQGIAAIARLQGGPELQVNSYTPGNQLDTAVAADDDGDFVVAWTSAHDGSVLGVFARRFDQTGAPLAGELQVNSYVENKQYLPAVAADADGDFVVAWSSYAQDGSSYGVFGRRFNSAGNPQTGELQVNTYTSGYQILPAVAMKSNGDFVVAWQSNLQDGANYGVFARRFNAAGSPQGAELQVNSHTANNQRFPAIAVGDDGRFVVAWQSELQDGSAAGVFARRFDAAGSPQGGELQINTYTIENQSRPDVALAGDGSFVVTWHSNGQDGSFNGVFSRRFDAAGVPQAAELQANTYTPGSQTFPQVAMAGSGDFVITWTSDAQDGSTFGVFARRFDATGAPQASEFQVNTYATSEQSFPAVAANQEGDFVIAWASLRDGDGRGIFARRFVANRPGDIDGNGSIAALTDGLLLIRYLFGLRGTPLTTGAVAGNCTRCTAAAIESYIAAKV